MPDKLIAELREAAARNQGHSDPRTNDSELLLQAADTLELMRDTHKQWVDALTPSGETKAAYIGEFRIDLPDFDENGEEYTRPINVPWTIIKDIMTEIRKFAEKS